MPTPLEEFLFDVQGYTILRGALDADHLRAINEWVDDLPPLKNDDWYGNIEVHSYRGPSVDGINLQNVIEGGEIFERLIDHPSWIDLVRHYQGTKHTSIHEIFLNVRGQGGYLGVHGGGWAVDGTVRSGIDRGKWCIQYISMILALNDIGPGDGATILIPGSHKCEFQHPSQKVAGISEVEGQKVEGAVEMHLKAGDVLFFNDAVVHGSAARDNSGHRRTIVFRYLPRVYAHRHGYVPSEELQARLTPQRKAIVMPTVPRQPPVPAPAR